MFMLFFVCVLSEVILVCLWKWLGGTESVPIQPYGLGAAASLLWPARCGLRAAAFVLRFVLRPVRCGLRVAASVFAPFLRPARCGLCTAACALRFARQARGGLWAA